MTMLIAASSVRTCLGGGAQTFAALLRGECGAGPLRQGDPAKLNVHIGYHIGGDDPNQPFRAGRLLAECLTEAVSQAGLDLAANRVVALIGTGLRELSAVEAYAASTAAAFPAERLHFGAVVRATVDGVAEVITLSNACSAGGHALGLAEDMLAAGEADAVIVGAADVMTQSMLAMIGRVAPSPTRMVRPFDAHRTGVLLGEGAAALVLVPPSWTGPALGRVVATGLSCDAHHETAPDVAGICRAMRDAFDRSGRLPSTVDLVVAHGTGTTLNDPAECEALQMVLRAGGADPLVTAAKGAIGHTSGSAALVNVDLALRCLAEGVVPPVVGLREVLPEAGTLRFVIGRPMPAQPRLVQINAFGFGGVNAVTLLEPAP